VITHERASPPCSFSRSPSRPPIQPVLPKMRNFCRQHSSVSALHSASPARPRHTPDFQICTLADASPLAAMFAELQRR